MGYSNGILESDVKGEGGVRGEQGLPGIGFKLTDDGNFDIDSKRLTDVGKPTENSDATTKAYVDDAIGHHTGNFYHLRQSFTFYDSSDNLLPLSTDSITGLVTDYKHGYYKIPKSGDDSTFSTLDIKITNNLTQSTYSALFYLYGYRNGNLMRGVDLGPILFSVVGTDDYNILKYDDEDSTETTDHTKAIIWFTSNGQQGSIELGLRFFDRSITHFVILSRCVEGKVNLGFSSNIFNVPSTVGDVTLYFEDINMNSRKIKNLGDPGDDTDAANKKYVNAENAKQNRAIRDKASKSFVENEDLKLMDYLDNVVYSYSMDSYIHNNAKLFIFRDIGSEFFKPETKPGDAVSNTYLKINVTGKCILIYDDMFRGTGELALIFKKTIDGAIDSVFYTNMSYSKWTTRRIRYEFTIDSIRYLSIFAQDSLLLDGSGADVQKFRLYVISDSTYISYSDNRYLKLDGSNPMKGNLDAGGKNILKVENLTDYKDTDPYDYRVKDVKSVVNKEYLNENFMKKVDKDGIEYYDTKGRKITGTGPYNKDLFDHPDDLVSKAYVDNVNEKQDTTINNISSISSYNTNIITSLQTSKVDQQYVDDNFLNLNGSRTMQDNLNMGDHSITGIRSSSADNAALTVGGAKATFVPLHGNRSMQGNLNMANHSIINLKDPKPSDASYAASVNFVNNTVNGSNLIINGEINKKIKESEERAIRAVQQENVFEKVMVDDLFILEDDDIHKVAVVDKDFHKVNQQTYQFKIDYDSDIGYYSTRLSVNVVYLPIGYYTIVFEMYFSDKIDPDNITINARSGTLSVSKINTKQSSDHTRSVINFYKAVIYPSDDELDIDIALKNKAGQSYEADTQIYVVVYGVAGTQSDVDVRLWDIYFYIDDKKIHFEAPIDMVNKDIENVNDLSINNELNMNNRQIKNVGDGNENADAVNVKQLNGMETNITNYVTGEIGKVNPVLSNNSDLIKFIYRNIIRNDSRLFLIKELYFPDSVNGRTQNNYTYQTNGDNKGDVTFYLTFIHKTSIGDDNMSISLHWEGITSNIQIFVSKDKVEASINHLIDESSLQTYNIPSYYQGKQLYLWITIQNEIININFSGSRAISGRHPGLENNDANIFKIRVSDSPFTIQRGLITKNIYNQNSDVFGDVREYEISEGTFIAAS